MDVCIEWISKIVAFHLFKACTGSIDVMAKALKRMVHTNGVAGKQWLLDERFYVKGFQPAAVLPDIVGRHPDPGVE